MPRKARLPFPILFINFKTYAQATGKSAISLAKKAAAVATREKASIALVVQAADLRLVSKAVRLPVFAQHLDPVEFGSHTGAILPEAVRAAGAVGTVLNHAENKRSNSFLKKAISEARESGLLSMACAESLARAKKIASFGERPDLIAVEPPGLIGGGKSVSSAKPELITDSVKAIKSIAPRVRVITGAGICNAEDVRKALEFGTKGVFVASAIVKARDQKTAIREIVSGFKK